ncbi:discoidin domain-containing protein [Saccharothrix saharensis]|uniref:discoidin domain-containing protein n=1 Tax=Saccharothrix saharensis TaxID=571190 RepID=UPI0036A5B758
MSPDDIVNRHIKTLEARYCSFLLNCMPNPEGWLDDHIVATLRQVGTLWAPNTSRPPLPQSVTVDLGSTHSDLDALTCLPRQDIGSGVVNTTGNITGYRVLTSTDGGGDAILSEVDCGGITTRPVPTTPPTGS